MTREGPSVPASLQGARVLVTGASGYIGSEVVRQLLELGFVVRAAVRDPSNGAKTEHLRRMASELDARERFELVSADLMVSGSFDAAVEGVRGVFHMAAAVILQARDPQRQIVDVAVEGTRNVLASIARAGSVEVLVMTSSVAAVVDESRPHSHVFDETDWNEGADVKTDPYPVAKLRSERAAYAWAEAQGDAAPRLVTLQPTLVLGPLAAKAHRRSSPAVLRDLVNGGFPGVPNFHFGIVDVRDVAEAHVRAFLLDGARGRYLLDAGGVHMREMAKTLRRRFPAAKVPRFGLPNLLMYVGSLFDRRVSLAFLRRNLGVVRRIDASRACAELGLSYRDREQTLIETVESFERLGLARW